MPLMFFGPQTMAPPAPPPAGGSGVGMPVTFSQNGAATNWYFLSQSGQPAPSPSAEWTPGTAITLTALGVNITANTQSAPTTVQVVVNGVATALSVVVPALATGLFQVTGSVAVGPADTVSLEVVTAGVGLENVSGIAVYS